MPWQPGGPLSPASVPSLSHVRAVRASRVFLGPVPVARVALGPARGAGKQQPPPGARGASLQRPSQPRVSRRSGPGVVHTLCASLPVATAGRAGCRGLSRRGPHTLVRALHRCSTRPREETRVRHGRPTRPRAARQGQSLVPRPLGPPDVWTLSCSGRWDVLSGPKPGASLQSPGSTPHSHCWGRTHMGPSSWRVLASSHGDSGNTALPIMPVRIPRDLEGSPPRWGPRHPSPENRTFPWSVHTRAHTCVFSATGPSLPGHLPPSFVQKQEQVLMTEIISGAFPQMPASPG